MQLRFDLIAYGSSEAGTTERAVRKLSTKLEMSNNDIRRQLEKGDSLQIRLADGTLLSRVEEVARL